MEDKIKNENNKKKILIVLFIVIAFTLGFFGGYLIKDTQSSNKDNSKESTNTNIEDNTNENNDTTQNNNNNNNNNNDSEEKNNIEKKEHKKLSIDDEEVKKLFDIYHAINYISKEQIAFNQLSEKDIIEVSCDFFSDEVIEKVNKGMEYHWCGNLTDEIKNAWNNKNGQKVLELNRKNTTIAVKEDALRNKFIELFGTDEMSDSTSTNGGDPSIDEVFKIKSVSQDDDYLYIEYDIYLYDELDYTHTLVFKIDDNENYIFVEDRK